MLRLDFRERWEQWNSIELYDRDVTLQVVDDDDDVDDDVEHCWSYIHGVRTGDLIKYPHEIQTSSAPSGCPLRFGSWQLHT